MKFIRFTAFCGAALLTVPAALALEPAPGADELCVGYEETHEGVWQDQSGADVLLFRFALNRDGSVCYAWLHSVAQWDIARAGSSLGDDAEFDGPLRIWGERPVRGVRGVLVNVETGAALYAGGGPVTRGRLLNR